MDVQYLLPVNFHQNLFNSCIGEVEMSPPEVRVAIFVYRLD